MSESRSSVRTVVYNFWAVRTLCVGTTGDCCLLCAHQLLVVDRSLILSFSLVQLCIIKCPSAHLYIVSWPGRAHIAQCPFLWLVTVNFAVFRFSRICWYSFQRRCYCLSGLYSKKVWLDCVLLLFCSATHQTLAWSTPIKLLFLFVVFLLFADFVLAIKPILWFIKSGFLFCASIYLTLAWLVPSSIFISAFP